MAEKPSLDQLLKGIDHAKLIQICTDQHLSEIARQITEWESIAPDFELDEVDEEEIVKKYPKKVKAQNLAMLRRWRKKRGDKATYKRLAKVFWKVDRTDLVVKLCKILSRESSSSESEGESEQGCAGGSGSQRWTVPRYANYLKRRYRTTRPPVQSHQLLPPPTRTVFNLALIQKERLEFGPNEELVRLLQRGQVKEAAESHTEIELSNLMKADDEERKIILIEGAPGSGKSTLAWHICQQWEKGELFAEYEVVVFVQLRDPKVQSAKAVADILPVPSQSMGTAVASLLTGDGRWGKGVLLVLDGWDELQPDCPAHSLLMQLVQIPDYLNMDGSSLIITSRPVSSGELQCYASSKVEVLGFKPEEVQQYFKACFGRDHQLFTRFVRQLNERPVIAASCFLPINAVIVFITFRASNCSLPRTLHEVFEKLVLSCIVRHVTDREEFKSRFTASCLADLPPDIEVPLSALSSLAFHGVWVNKVVFSERDLNFFNLPTDLSSTLSLVQVVESFGVCGRSKSYNFFHLQIQELLAAYHISKLEENEQVKIFKELFGQPRFAAVFQFYAAFTKLQAEGIREVLVEISKSPLPYDFVLQCVYEAQDPSLCQFLGWTLNMVQSTMSREPLLVLSSQSSKLHIITLGYFLCCHCYNCNEEVSVLVKEIDVVSIQLLVKEFFHHQTLITPAPSRGHNYGSLAFVLRISGKRYWNSLVQCATELLRSFQPFIKRLAFDMMLSMLECELRSEIVGECLKTSCGLVPSLQHFELSDSLGSDPMTIDERGLLEFVQSLCSSNQLRSFKFRGVKLQISPEAANLVFSALATNSAIEYLILCNCHFSVIDSAEQAFSATQFSSTLKVIDFTGTPLGGYVAAVLMGLFYNTSVVELILENCNLNLTEMDGVILQYMLKTNTTLKALNLHGGIIMDMVSRCYVGYTHTVGLQYVCDGLTSNTSLAYLDLRMCQLTVTEKSGSALTHMLQTNTTLKSLKLDANPGISNAGAVYLAQGLAQNTGLETLSISNCGISTAVVKLAEAIKANGHLYSLDVSGNQIGERFVCIVNSLQVNHTLQDLKASGCGIPAQGIQHLDVRSSLTSLDISQNPIGDEGAIHVAQLVTRSHALFQLDLRQCGVGDRGVECLASALEVNTVLEIFHVSWNIFTDAGLMVLGKSLKRNRALKLLNVHQLNIGKAGIPHGNTTLLGEKQFVLSLCENEHVTDLCVTHAKEMSDEVDQINQGRREKNCNILKVLIPLNVIRMSSPHIHFRNYIKGLTMLQSETDQ